MNNLHPAALSEMLIFVATHSPGYFLPPAQERAGGFVFLQKSFLLFLRQSSTSSCLWRDGGGGKKMEFSNSEATAKFPSGFPQESCFQDSICPLLSWEFSGLVKVFCSWQGWNEMVFKVPSNPNRSVTQTRVPSHCVPCQHSNGNNRSISPLLCFKHLQPGS